ncbi:MAG: SRPBCC family protein [Gemmatimonadales bacterium]|nr:SRPBCC family protein [Gemmatimonadales bacterium]
MQITTSVIIQAPKEAVWKAVTDIENAAKRISAIESVEVLEKPERGMVGFKWKETRTMMGKTATEIMWVTEAVELEFYRTRAESHGAIYICGIELKESGGATELTMRFDGQPVTLFAKVFWACLGFMFVGATKKALNKDLQDIKAYVEGKSDQVAQPR